MKHSSASSINIMLLTKEIPKNIQKGLKKSYIKNIKIIFIWVNTALAEENQIVGYFSETNNTIQDKVKKSPQIQSEINADKR